MITEDSCQVTSRSLYCIKKENKDWKGGGVEGVSFYSLNVNSDVKR